MKFALPVCLIFVLTIFTFGQAQEKVLYSFGSIPNDGLYPSSVIPDADGNLYGTTTYGGTSNDGGAVFELSPQQDGTWVETILYNFCSQVNCTDGENPLAGLVIDAAGNLYGTASLSYCTNGAGKCGGTAFELSPPSLPGGTWSYSILYTFCSVFKDNACQDGSEPNSQLIFDKSGNLYGTSGGGKGGLVFELSPEVNGWTESVVYDFCLKSSCPDGEAPMGGVAFDKAGNLYGTTQHGGRYRLGVVFELTQGNGGWTEAVLMSFYLYGSSLSPVSFDAAGNLYSTTLANAFQLNAKSHTQGNRVFTAATGDYSVSGVLIDAARNTLFGANAVGGVDNGGTIWQVNPARQLSPLYNFCSVPNCTDGDGPASSLIEDASGNIYGTTRAGGVYGEGVVFEITP